MKKNVFIVYNLIFLFIITLFGGGFAFADTDCSLSINYQITPSLWAPYSGAFPFENLTLARDHLYASCCKDDLFPKTDYPDCSQGPQEVYLESPYMIDHLIDIGLRSLDYASAYSGQIVDSGAKAWYDFLHTGTQSVTPLMVQSQYKNYRSLTHLPLLQDEAGDLTNYLPLYSSFTLRDKYLNLCFVIKKVYEDVIQSKSQKWPVVFGDQYSSTSLYTRCMNLAQTKIANELSITQAFMLQSSTLTLKNSIDSYIMVNFVRDNLSSLLSKFQGVVQLFAQFVTQAPISKRCAY